MDILEKLLFDLSSESTVGSSLDALALASNIDKCLRETSDGEEKASCAAILVTSESPPNMFRFCATHIRSNDKNLIKAKILLLKLVSFLIKEDCGLGVHMIRILELTFDIFKREV